MDGRKYEERFGDDLSRLNRPVSAQRTSIAFDALPQPDFADAVIVAIPHGAKPIPNDPAWWAGEVFNEKSAPRWVALLMAIRQALVGLIGVSRGEPDTFTVRRVADGEALIAADENHLDFRAAVGVDVEARLLTITTAVRLHGWRGRLYFAPVSVLHGPVTRSMAKRAVQRWRTS